MRRSLATRTIAVRRRHGRSDDLSLPLARVDELAAAQREIGAQAKAGASASYSATILSRMRARIRAFNATHAGSALIDSAEARIGGPRRQSRHVIAASSSIYRRRSGSSSRCRRPMIRRAVHRRHCRGQRLREDSHRRRHARSLSRCRATLHVSSMSAPSTTSGSRRRLAFIILGVGGIRSRTRRRRQPASDVRLSQSMFVAAAARSARRSDRGHR